MGETHMKWARTIVGLSAPAKNVLNALAWEADDASQAMPGTAELELWTGLHRTSIFRAVSELCHAGLVSVVKTEGKANLYTLQVGATSSGERLVAESDGSNGLTSSGERLHQSQRATGRKNRTSFLKALTTDDDDLHQSSSSSFSAPKKRKARPDDSGAAIRFGGLWTTRTFSGRQVRNGAWHMAAEWNLHGEWIGFETWLAEADLGEVVRLLHFLAHYDNKGIGQLERIENFTGILRSHLKNDGTPALNSRNVEKLERYCSMPLQEEIRAVGPVPAKRSDMVWVTAD